MAIILSPLDSRSISLTAVSDSADLDDPDLILNGVENSVVAHPYSIDICLTDEWHTARGARLLRQ
jgi:hypothetical protein